MQEVKQLLYSYLEGKISSENFVVEFLSLVRQLRNETYEALGKKPRLKEEFDRLFREYSNGSISKSAYDERWENLINQLGEVRIKPYSREDEAVSHLFVEADAYREDPELRQDGLHIGDVELRKEVEKVLQVLR